MTDITQTAKPVVHIWNYVEELVKGNIINNYVYENNLVESVYRNDTSTFDHVLLPTKTNNVFIVIIIDLLNEVVLGHFKLDLNQEYEVE